MADLYKQIEELGVVPVVVLKDPNNALDLAKALLAGGVTCIEVTFRTEHAEESIKRIHKAYPQMLMGAGTVINIDQAQRAVDAGAQFIVSPGLDKEIVKWCQSKNIPVIPGVCTPTEVQAGVCLGLNILKFFPAEAAGGVNMIKNLCGPFPNVRFMATGGISMANLESYISSPHIVAIGGSWMVKSDLIESKNWEKITELSKQALTAVKEIRK